jgi:hypothetical protein
VIAGLKAMPAEIIGAGASAPINWSAAPPISSST